MSHRGDAIKCRDLNRTLLGVLGRFTLCRRIYGRIIPQFRDRSRHVPSHRRARVSLAARPIDMVTVLREEGLTTGLSAESSIIEQIGSFANGAPIHSLHRGQAIKYTHREVKKGRLPDGTPVGRGDIEDPMDCDAVGALAHDPAVMEVVSEYFGYAPKILNAQMWWTFASDFSLDEKQDLRIATRFHYDVHRPRSLLVGYYLTDTDKRDGARILLKGSHGPKPLPMLLRSRSFSDKEIYDRFGRGREVLLEGKSGAAFIHDPFCIHKVANPVGRDRLVLEFIYG